MKPHILVAVPTMGTMSTSLAAFLLSLVLNENKKFDVTVFLPEPPKIPHDSARNNIVNAFLENERFTHLLQIDSDVVPPANILDMVEHDADIVSGVYFVWNHEEVVPICGSDEIVDGKKQLVFTRFSADGPRLVPVHYIGGGCVLAKRKVFEKFRNKKQVPYAFDYQENGIMWRGEDFNFSAKARQLGFEIFVDKTMICRHYKTVELAQMNLLLNTYLRAGKQNVPHTTDGNGNSDGGTNAGEGPPTARGTDGERELPADRLD